MTTKTAPMMSDKRKFFYKKNDALNLVKNRNNFE